MTQVESFIPLWEWDVSKQKSKKRKSKEEGGKEKSGKSNGSAAGEITGGSTTAIETAGAAGSAAVPRLRSAMIEEVEDDGS